MKKRILFYFAFIFFVSCGNNTAEEQTAADDSVTTEIDNNFTWQAVLNDTTGNIEMIKMPGDVEGAFTPENIIASLNERNPDIQVHFIKTSSDTVYTSIPDATYLTQQMGSTGPSLYFSSLVYSLTEVPHIHFVNISFQEGDHAQPGTYSRENFENQ